MNENDFPPGVTFKAYRPLAVILIASAGIWGACFYYWPTPTFIVAGAALGIFTSFALGSSLRDRLRRRKDELDPRRSP